MWYLGKGKRKSISIRYKIAIQFIPFIFHIEIKYMNNALILMKNLIFPTTKPSETFIYAPQ